MKKLLKSFLCVFLILSMLLPVLVACNDDEGTDDDETEDGGGGDSDGGTDSGMADYMSHSDKKFEVNTEYEPVSYIVSPSDTAAYSAMGLTADTSVVRDGSTSSGKWASLNPSYVPINYSGDITGYEAIGLWVYSERSTDSVMQFCINCQQSVNTNGSPTTAYKRHEIKTDFTGWKLIILPLERFADGYGADFTKVSNMRINATGWGVTAVNPSTTLYIDSIFFAKQKTDATISQIGDYNYDHIIDTLVSYIIGDKPITEMSDTDKPKLQAMINQAKSAQADLIRTEGAKAPYNYDMSTTENITSNHNRILQMARGYAIKGGELYHNEQLLADIVYAMDLMHENYYKDKSLNTYPKRNNWWNWEIGSPQHIVNIIMLCKESLTEEQINKWLAPVNKYVPGPSMTMANLIDIDYVLVAAGAIQKDAVKIARARDSVYECCVYVKKGDGFYTDGSFVQHNNIAYTGSYGPIIPDKASQLAVATQGTCFRFDDAIFDHMYNWTVDSYTPLMYHGAFFGLVRGRSICRTSTDVSLGLTAVKGMLRLTRLLSDAEKNKVLKEILLEYYAYNEDYYNSSLSPVDLAIMNEIKADSTVSARVGYTMAKIFAMMDRAIAHKDGYAVGVSMSSTRIAKYEAINEENGNGWYTGDGMLYVYTDVNDYEPAFWRNVNMYRLPGTTVTNAPRVDKNISNTGAMGADSFAGGASLGNSMVAAMKFESAAPGIGFSSTLKGNKAWFVLGDKIICLGGGITSNESAYRSETIIENRRTTVLKVNGQDVSGSTGTITDSKIYLGDFGGIYLPSGGTVTYNKVKNNGVDFTELYFDHGIKFSNSKYAYVLLPNMTEQELADYEPDFEILVCGANVMGVRDNETGITAYVFFKEGTYGSITAYKPCVIMMDGTTMAVSDPTQTQSSITVKINDVKYIFDGLECGATKTKPLA